MSYDIDISIFKDASNTLRFGVLHSSCLQKMNARNMVNSILNLMLIPKIWLEFRIRHMLSDYQIATFEMISCQNIDIVPAIASRKTRSAAHMSNMYTFFYGFGSEKRAAFNIMET